MKEVQTFAVRNLGRVQAADIELRPFTLLVGENNSGKSYVATAAWALFQARASIFEQPDADEWQWALTAAEEIISRLRKNPLPYSAMEKINSEGLKAPEETDLVEIDFERWQKAAVALHEVAAGRLLQEAFRAPVGGEITFPTRNRVPLLGCLSRDGEEGQGEIFVTLLPSEMLSVHSTVPSARQLASGMLAWTSGLPGHLPVTSMGDMSNPRGADARFLPASRSGFLQLLPDVLDRLLATGPYGEAALSNVTAPTIQFLRSLVLQLPGFSIEPKHGDLADLLESEVLSGQVGQGRGTGQYTFSPEGASVELPMSRVSSVVSELVPLVTLLREGVQPSVLVYEEPEAHLHPRLQRVVALALVRLVRRGVKVLVTTHSDTFVQQINNFIKLGALGLDDEQREALSHETQTEKYGEEDYLLLDDVAAYEFNPAGNGRTVVERLAVGPDGVVFPMFNRELVRLAAEVVALDNASEG